MSLVKCLQCGKETADSLAICSQCGCPIKEFHDGKTDEFNYGNNRQSPPAFGSGETDDSHERPSFWRYTAAKVLTGLAVFSICLSLYSIFSEISLSSAFANFKNYYAEDTVAYEEEMAAYKEYVEDEINAFKEQNKYLLRELELSKLGIAMSEGVVTDKVFVAKALFYVSGDNGLSGTIDIRPQPSYSSKFLGGGEFNLTDRELKRMLDEIIKETLTYGDTTFDLIETLFGYSVDQGIITITEKNYNVATYESGVVTLYAE